MSRQNIDAVRRMLQAFNDGDIEAIVAECDPAVLSARSPARAGSPATPSSPAPPAAPIPVSSGKTYRHRLDRGGNRQINATIHRIAVTRLRCHPETQH